MPAVTHAHEPTTVPGRDTAVCLSGAEEMSEINPEGKGGCFYFTDGEIGLEQGGDLPKGKCK